MKGKTTIRVSAVMFLAFCLFVYASLPSHIDLDMLYGQWRGRRGAQELFVEFRHDQTCMMRFRDVSSGAVEILYGRFAVDATKMPMPLTIRDIPQYNHPLHTIISFLHQDAIRLAGFSTQWKLRPVSFKHENTVVLHRVQREP